jgi:threonylcarbamoyladenosine tRNA methylthiotransferase MtaB
VRLNAPRTASGEGNCDEHLERVAADRPRGIVNYMRYRVAFETLGCRLNQAETANMHRSFLDKGYLITENSAEADLCVVNTCALTSQAASKCRRKIRSIVRKNPDVCVAAVGCYAQTDTEVLRGIRGVDYIVGTADKLHLAEIIPEPVKLPEAVVVAGKAARRAFRIGAVGYYPTHTRANVKIQEGCDFVCSFCIIPRSRGPARSRDFHDIMRESRALVSQGHRELILTGVNLGTYSHGARGLKELIEALSKIRDLKRIRLSSIEPSTVDSGLLDLMSEGGKLCPYLHVSLQSGDDGILRSMRRNYTAGEFRQFVEILLRRVPAAGLGTDVMVGFPGESEEAFERTHELVESIPFTHIHVFSFSARKGTAAYLMKNKVPADIIRRRSDVMHRLGEKKKEAYYKGSVGKSLRVLFEERESGGFYVGFSDNYVKVGIESSQELANRFRWVNIEGVRRLELSDSLLATGRITRKSRRP